MALCGMLSSPILEFAGSIISAKPIRHQGYTLKPTEYQVAEAIPLPASAPTDQPAEQYSSELGRDRGAA